MKNRPIQIVMAVIAGLSCIFTTNPCFAEDAPKGSSVGSFTIEKAISVAMEHSPVIKIAQENWRRAGGSLREARGSTGPSLGVGVSYQRFDKVEEANLGPESIKIGTIDAKHAKATLSQPVDVSRLLGAGLDAASWQEKAARFDLDATRQELALNVRASYLNVLLAREQEKVASESASRLQEYLRLAKVRFDAGSVPKFDVLRAETELANAEQSLISAQNDIVIVELIFANVLGVKLESSPQLKRPEVVEKPIPEVESLVQKGLRTRPEAKSNEAILEAAKSGVHIARRGLKPTMRLDFNYNWNGSTTIFSPRSLTADAMASLNIPIFDNGVTKGRIEQAEASVSSAQAAKEQTDLRIRLEVEQSYTSITNARKRLSAALLNLEQSTESRRLAQVRYESGVGTAVEVTDAEVALTLAQTNLVSARYDLLLSYAKLARAVGDPSLVLD